MTQVVRFHYLLGVETEIECDGVLEILFLVIPVRLKWARCHIFRQTLKLTKFYLISKLLVPRSFYTGRTLLIFDLECFFWAIGFLLMIKGTLCGFAFSLDFFLDYGLGWLSWVSPLMDSESGRSSVCGVAVRVSAEEGLRGGVGLHMVFQVTCSDERGMAQITLEGSFASV